MEESDFVLGFIQCLVVGDVADVSVVNDAFSWSVYVS
jgi:hypothetical protein